MRNGPKGSRARDKRVRIERPVPDTSFDGAGSGSWATVAEEWAEVQDVLPSRGEKLADGINIATRPARLRMAYRDDVTPDMRILLLKWAGSDWTVGRTLQIVAGPAEIGRRSGIELMVEDYSTAGNAA